MNSVIIEKHPFKPFLPRDAKLLMCGSFPPKQEKWSMDFYYPNYINDMWRIYGLIFLENKDALLNLKEKKTDKEKVKKLLLEKGIALAETAREVVRTKDNASDKYLEVIKKIDLPNILSQLPQCNNLATTGEKAAQIIAEITKTELPKIGEYQICKIITEEGSERIFNHWRMPSSSRAYPLKLEEKAKIYKEMMQNIGLIN